MTMTDVAFGFLGEWECVRTPESPEMEMRDVASLVCWWGSSTSTASGSRDLRL